MLLELVSFGIIIASLVAIASILWYIQRLNEQQNSPSRDSTKTPSSVSKTVEETKKDVQPVPTLPTLPTLSTATGKLATVADVEEQNQIEAPNWLLHSSTKPLVKQSDALQNSRPFFVSSDLAFPPELKVTNYVGKSGKLENNPTIDIAPNLSIPKSDPILKQVITHDGTIVTPVQPVPGSSGVFSNPQGKIVTPGIGPQGKIVTPVIGPQGKIEQSLNNNSRSPPAPIAAPPHAPLPSGKTTQKPSLLTSVSSMSKESVVKNTALPLVPLASKDSVVKSTALPPVSKDSVVKTTALPPVSKDFVVKTTKEQVSQPLKCALHEDYVDDQCIPKCKAGFLPVDNDPFVCRESATCKSEYEQADNKCIRRAKTEPRPFADPDRLGSNREMGCSLLKGEYACSGKFNPKTQCPDGMRDDGVNCWMDSYPRTGTAMKRTPCPEGTRDDGTSCWKGARIVKNVAQRPRTCPNGMEQHGNQCYPVCKHGYRASGCCLCEPQGGSGIKITSEQRRVCEEGTFSCFMPCPAGFTLKGLNCFRDSDSYELAEYKRGKLIPKENSKQVPKENSKPEPNVVPSSIAKQTNQITVVKCNDNQDLVNNVCIAKCKTGFAPVANAPQTCREATACKTGYREEGNRCVKSETIAPRPTIEPVKIGNNAAAGCMILKGTYACTGKYIERAPCPPNMRDDKSSCWLDTYSRGTGRAMIREPCPEGTRDDGTSCWKGARIVKNVGQRPTKCPDGFEKNGLLCYPKCKDGYRAVGCCLCEPIGGPGMKVTAEQRRKCEGGVFTCMLPCPHGTVTNGPGCVIPADSYSRSEYQRV
jgi:hypothetical protein